VSLCRSEASASPSRIAPAFCRPFGDALWQELIGSQEARDASTLADDVPSGGEARRSPVSLSMGMAYRADGTGRGDIVQPISTVVGGTHDYTYRGNGNWALNTAYASSLGLDA
jgi:hypothetical protein